MKNYTCCISLYHLKHHLIKKNIYIYWGTPPLKKTKYVHHMYVLWLCNTKFQDNHSDVYVAVCNQSYSRFHSIRYQSSSNSSHPQHTISRVQGILARQEEDAIQDAKDEDCDSLEGNGLNNSKSIHHCSRTWYYYH